MIFPGTKSVLQLPFFNIGIPAIKKLPNRMAQKASKIDRGLEQILGLAL